MQSYHTHQGPSNRVAYGGLNRFLSRHRKDSIPGMTNNFISSPALRYYVGISLVLIMLLLPIKMYLRWAFNFKYFVHIQEFFFNI